MALPGRKIRSLVFLVVDVQVIVAFAMLETLLCKAKLRTVEELWNKLAELSDVFSPEECKNYFKNAGMEKHRVKNNGGCP